MNTQVKITGRLAIWKMKKGSRSTHQLLLFRVFLAVSEYTLHNDVIVQIDDFLMSMDKQREIKSNKVQLLKQQKKRWWGRGLWLRVFQRRRGGSDLGLSSAPGAEQDTTGRGDASRPRPGAQGRGPGAATSAGRSAPSWSEPPGAHTETGRLPLCEPLQRGSQAPFLGSLSGH